VRRAAALDLQRLSQDSVVSHAEPDGEPELIEQHADRPPLVARGSMLGRIEALREDGAFFPSQMLTTLVSGYGSSPTRTRRRNSFSSPSSRRRSGSLSVRRLSGRGRASISSPLVCERAGRPSMGRRSLDERQAVALRMLRFVKGDSRTSLPTSTRPSLAAARHTSSELRTSYDNSQEPEEPSERGAGLLEPEPSERPLTLDQMYPEPTARPSGSAGHSPAASDTQPTGGAPGTQGVSASFQLPAALVTRLAPTWSPQLSPTCDSSGRSLSWSPISQVDSEAGRIELFTPEASPMNRSPVFSPHLLMSVLRPSARLADGPRRLGDRSRDVPSNMQDRQAVADQMQRFVTPKTTAGVTTRIVNRNAVKALQFEKPIAQASPRPAAPLPAGPSSATLPPKPSPGAPSHQSAASSAAAAAPPLEAGVKLGGAPSNEAQAAGSAVVALKEGSGGKLQPSAKGHPPDADKRGADVDRARGAPDLAASSAAALEPEQKPQSVEAWRTVEPGRKATPPPRHDAQDTLALMRLRKATRTQHAPSPAASSVAAWGVSVASPKSAPEFRAPLRPGPRRSPQSAPLVHPPTSRPGEAHPPSPIEMVAPRRYTRPGENDLSTPPPKPSALTRHGSSPAVTAPPSNIAGLGAAGPFALPPIAIRSPPASNRSTSPVTPQPLDGLTTPRYDDPRANGSRVPLSAPAACSSAASAPASGRQPRHAVNTPSSDPLLRHACPDPNRRQLPPLPVRAESSDGLPRHEPQRQMAASMGHSPWHEVRARVSETRGLFEVQQRLLRAQAAEAMRIARQGVEAACKFGMMAEAEVARLELQVLSLEEAAERASCSEDCSEPASPCITAASPPGDKASLDSLLCASLPPAAQPSVTPPSPPLQVLIPGLHNAHLPSLDNSPSFFD